MGKMNKKGFTLAELLIVIAIMAILLAVAIPVFTTQLEKAREAVDKSAARSANSMAYSEYMLSHQSLTEEVTYTFAEDAQGNLQILKHEGATAGELTTCNGNGTLTAEIKGKSTKCSASLEVVIENGAIKSNTWLAALGVNMTE